MCSRVILSSSPGELSPVFQSMLENATRICTAKFGTLYRFDGEAFHFWQRNSACPRHWPNSKGSAEGFKPSLGGHLDRIMRDQNR